MTRIKSIDKKRQMVYIYSVGNVDATVELAHPDKPNAYNHIHLSIDELKAFTEDCQKLIAMMESSEKFEI